MIKKQIIEINVITINHSEKKSCECLSHLIPFYLLFLYFSYFTLIHHNKYIVLSKYVYHLYLEILPCSNHAVLHYALCNTPLRSSGGADE